MQISKPKGFPLLWLLAKKHQLTEMLCPSTLFFADKAFVKGAIYKKQPCFTLVTSPYKENNSQYNYYGIIKILQPRTAVGPDLKMSVLSAIALQFIQLCIQLSKSV